MRLYHVTDAAADILRFGFVDGEGSYGLATTTLKGVFVSDEPLDVNEGAVGADMIELTVPDDLDLSAWELIEEGKGYREWCVPAEVLNESARLRRLDAPTSSLRPAEDSLRTGEQH